MIKSYTDMEDSRVKETKYKWYMANHKIKNIMAKRLDIHNVAASNMDCELNLVEEDIQWLENEESNNKHITTQDDDDKERNINYAMLPITPRLN